MSPDPPPEPALNAIRPRLHAVLTSLPARPENEPPRPTQPPSRPSLIQSSLERDDTEGGDLSPATESTGDLADVEARAAAALARARAELPERERAVFACWLGQVALTLEPSSEADPIGILVCLIAGTSVHLGPNPHLRAGDDRHPLLIWPMLVGRTMMGKKGTAWAAALRVLSAADPEFATQNIHSGLTSGEGLATLFHDDPASPDSSKPNQGETRKDTAAPRNPSGRRKAPRHPTRLLPAGDYRLLDVEPEWGAVMARMRREGNSLSATLRAAWEGGNLSTLTVTARVARTSHIGVLAHITPDEFRAKVRESDLAGGTYNRFLPVFVACSKFLPGSTGAPDNVVSRLGMELADRLDKATSTAGLITLAHDGETAWRRLYLEFGASGDTDIGPVMQFTARAAPNCLRVAALYAALDGTSITAAHLAAAAALVRYSIDSARAVFANGDTDRVVAFIAAAGADGRTKTEITNGLYGKNAPRGRIDAALTALLVTGRITRTRRPTRGRPVEIYTASHQEETE